MNLFTPTHIPGGKASPGFFVSSDHQIQDEELKSSGAGLSAKIESGSGAVISQQAVESAYRDTNGLSPWEEKQRDARMQQAMIRPKTEMAVKGASTSAKSAQMQKYMNIVIPSEPAMT